MNRPKKKCVSKKKTKDYDAKPIIICVIRFGSERPLAVLVELTTRHGKNEWNKYEIPRQTRTCGGPAATPEKNTAEGPARMKRGAG